jgi:hypothetical protein
MKPTVSQILIVGLMVGAGCVDKVTFVPPDATLPFVVDGVFNGTDTAIVRLSTAYPADGKFHITRVLGANVWITDENDITFVLDFKVKEGTFEQGLLFNGTAYIASKVVKPQVNHKYVLHVRTSGGVEFTSAPQLILPAGSVDSIYYEFVSSFNRTRNVPEDGINVYFNATLPSDGERLVQWQVNGTYEARTNPSCPCASLCYVYEREDYPLVSSPQIIKTDKVARVFATYIPINGTTFTSRYRVEVVQLAIDPATHEFMSAIRQQMLNSSSLFQPPYFVGKGNMSSLSNQHAVIGVFTAAREARTFIYIKRSDIPFKIRDAQLNADCLNAFPGSTRLPPPFWE